MRLSSLLAAACLLTSLAQAAPLPSGQWQRRVIVRPNTDLNVEPNSMFNCRYFDGKIYANQINWPCFGRYASGSSVPEMLVNNRYSAPLEHRMVAPFRGSFRTNYLLGSSSAIGSATTFTRYDFNGKNPVTITAPDTLIADAFDWVDADTLIYAVYTSGSRNRLYLADVTADPFTITKNTTWNADGYATTPVSTRIRNVRVGDVYSGYAYYGDAGQNSNPNFYALNLDTGVSTLLGHLETLTGGGSFGLWTVVERGGYLYVQTTDNGIFVYALTDAITLGALYTTYTKEELDACTGRVTTDQYYGFDVSRDGTTMLLGAGFGAVYELGRPLLAIASEEPGVVLSWDGSVDNVVIQSSPSLSSPNFTDIYPTTWPEGKLFKASVPKGTGNEFFRLRQGP